MAKLKYRYQGQPPKVGIRPTVDGRLGGAREDMEGRTLAMARRVAKLLRDRLRHPSGHRVECVIPERCIGGVAESAHTADLFAREGVGVSLTVSPCWCYGTETIDLEATLPKAIWGYNGPERPGAVYLAAALAAHNQKGLPAFGIYGRDAQEPEDKFIPDDVQEKILRFVRAGLAAATMRGKSYLAMGGVSMGIAGSIVEQDFFQDYLGMRVMSLDMTEFIRRMDRRIYDDREYRRALRWVKKNCREGFDPNPPERQATREDKDKQWEVCVKMALIAKDLMLGNPRLAEMGYGEEALGHNAIAAGFQGQRQWTDHMPTGDFLEAILNSSFDWNGLRQPLIVATENDCLNGVTMLLSHLLTGTAQVFADVRTYWSPAAVKRATGYTLKGEARQGIIHLLNSGPAALDGTGQQSREGKPAMKPFWEISKEEIQGCLEATTWHPDNCMYFPAGGFSTRFLTRGGMPVTMARVNLVKGLGPVLQIAEGSTVTLPQKVHDVLDRRTDPTWPTTWFVPRTGGNGAFRDVYTVMNNWGANHGAVSYGHIGADLITLASMLRIPVFMHNVPEENIFRPSAWTAFGATDLQGADFRACQAYGALYK